MDSKEDLKAMLRLAVSEIRGCDRCIHGSKHEKYHRIFTCEKGEFSVGAVGGYKCGICKNFRWIFADDAEKLIND